jgi:hypothetical protein
MRLFLLMVLSFPAFAGETVLDNEYVRVTRDAAPCAAAGPACADRIIVALGNVKVVSGDSERALSRGDIAVFGPDQSYTAPAAGAFIEVAIKPDHPPARSPGETIAPEKNALRHDGADFFVFEEKLAPGDTRARHSHSQRVVIQLNPARLQQWPDGEPPKFVDTVPDRPSFSPPVIHAVKNVGDTALRGIIIEFRPR